MTVERRPRLTRDLQQGEERIERVNVDMVNVQLGGNARFFKLLNIFYGLTVEGLAIPYEV